MKTILSIALIISACLNIVTITSFFGEKKKAVNNEQNYEQMEGWHEQDSIYYMSLLDSIHAIRIDSMIPDTVYIRTVHTINNHINSANTVNIGGK